MNYRTLLSHCRDGNEQAVKHILRHNPDVNILWSDGDLLKYTADNGHADVLEMLIEHQIRRIELENERSEINKRKEELFEKLKEAEEYCSKISDDLAIIFYKYEKMLSTESPIIGTDSSSASAASA